MGACGYHGSRRKHGTAGIVMVLRRIGPSMAIRHLHALASRLLIQRH